MKRLIFKELTMISFKERSARKVKFNENATVIYSIENNTGKSSILKSLYHTLGADTSFDSQWLSAEVITFLNFAVSEKEYTIMRDNKSFSLFDEQKELLGTWTKITEELAPQIAEIIGYKFTLTDWSQREVIPVPAYYFLPFYIDQDKGWVKNWSSFENLTQLPKWEDNTIKYHLGILTDQFFEINRKLNASRVLIKELKENIHSLDFALKKYTSGMDGETFRINIGDFQNDIKDLFESAEQLQQIQDEQKVILIELYNEQLLLRSQKSAIEMVIKGLEVDYDKLSRPCPTCGNLHESTFESRLKTSENEARCYQLLSETSLKLELVNDKISKVNMEYKEKAAELEKLHEVLSRQKQYLKFEDILRIEGTRNFINKIRNDIWAETRRLNEEEGNYKALLRERMKLIGKNREKEIQKYYLTAMKNYLNLLNLSHVKEKGYIDLKNKIKVKGSDSPRSILAYFFSVLMTKYENANSTFCPIVIDSPMQQDQSQENYHSMLNVIFNHRPENSQLILGVVDQPDIPFEGELIALENKFKVLEENEFDGIFNEVKIYLYNSLMSY